MMKTVLIVTDLEGISGVGSMEQMNDTEHGGYAYSCARLIADTNAAVAGAFEGGAERVLVEDGHGTGVNFIPGELDPRAEQVDMCAPGFSLDGVVCVMQVGAHAMSGTLCAFLDHTQSSVAWHDYKINSRRCGEMAQVAGYTGAFGIPCTMVSGDSAACMEARQFFGGEIACAEVKTALCRNRADCIGAEEAEARIRAAAKRGVALAETMKPFRVLLPMELTVEYNRADYCEAVCAWRDDIERLDARTVRRVVKEITCYRDMLI